MLRAVSVSDGTKLAEYRLDSPPVFDGMIAAGARLYLSLKNGTVLCMGPDRFDDRSVSAQDQHSGKP